MLQRDALEFLRRHPPFDRLDAPALEALVGALKMELHPAGAHILRQGALSVGALHIIKEGLVRISARTAPGHEPVLDVRGPGETFGFLAREEREPLDASVQAVTDTICYVADNAQVRKLLGDHPAIEEFLAPAYFPRREEAAPRAPAADSLLRDGSESILFTTPVRDLASRDVATVRADLPIVDAARLMATRRIGSVVVLDDAQRPAGIVTTADLRDRVLLESRDLAGPVGAVMSAPLITVEARDFCYEALLKMMSRGVHHLPVMDAGRLAGMLSNHDLMIVQGTSPLLIVREIEGQATVDGLAVSARKVLGLVSLLLREGAGAGSIIRVITSVNDRIERRIVDLAVRTLGPPPVPFCWIVYGSAGRKEQTFKTDQDNGIVYRDPDGAQQALAAQEYFGRLAEFVVDAFQRCGFARCAGNYMASNPQWRQPLGVWKQYFQDWIAAPADRAIYHAANFFDFRGLHGDLALAAELKRHLMSRLPGPTLFLKAMADLTASYRPPLSLFGTLQTEKGGDHDQTVNVKNNCLTPLVNVVRLFSFESNVPETSTVERLAALKTVHPAVRALGDDLAHAFEFLALLRIRRQFEQIAADREPDNFIDPKRLDSIERKSLTEICRVIARVLDDIEKKYDFSRGL